MNSGGKPASDRREVVKAQRKEMPFKGGALGSWE